MLVSFWEYYEGKVGDMQEFISSTLPSLNSKVRLSNMNSINQEISSKVQLQHEFNEIEDSLSEVKQKAATLVLTTSPEGKKAVEDKVKELEEKCAQVSENLHYNRHKSVRNFHIVLCQ